MTDDLDAAKAEFVEALPECWYVLEEFPEEFHVTIGTLGGEEAQVFRVAKPTTGADALRDAIARAKAR